VQFHVWVLPTGPRPDFRTVAAFLFPAGEDIDADGDAEHPASRDWTELDLQSRGALGARVSVSMEADAPLTLRVSSPSRQMALGVAYYLTHESGGEMRDAAGAPIDMAGLVDELRQGFRLDSRLNAAARSPYHRATRDEPFPR